MRKTIISLALTALGTLALTACQPDEMGIHPETRKVISKDPASLTIVCRTTWSDSSGDHHKDMTKEVSASRFPKIQVGDSC